MKKSNDFSDRVKVSLHVTNKRMKKTLIGYLELCCKDMVMIVDSESQVKIIDIDDQSVSSKALLAKMLAESAINPIIGISSQDVVIGDVIGIKNPIEIPNVVSAIREAKQRVQSQAKDMSAPDSVLEEEAENLHQTLVTTSINSEEVNQELDDFLGLSNIDSKETTSTFESLPSNNRKTVRYTIQSVKAKLVRNSLLASSKPFIVWVLNISSKGALIEMKVPKKIKGKVTLTIYFTPEHIFSVPAQIVREEGIDIYGLQFLSYQHELADYLVEYSHSFSIS